MAQPQAEAFRAMTYNVHHCEGLDGKIDYSRLCQVIRSAAPDVVAIQELDSVTTRTDGTYQLQRIAAPLRMKYTYARAIPYRGGAYGVGILSKETPLSVRRIPLPGNEKRVLLVCEFSSFVFSCTHLDGGQYCMESLPIILEEAKRSSKPFFIAGDFNASPKSAFMQAFMGHFQPLNAGFEKTVNDNNPNSCIDYIAYYRPFGNVTAGSYEIVDEPIASDHRPVVCNFAVTTSGISPTSASASLSESSLSLYNLLGHRLSSQCGSAFRTYKRSSRAIVALH